MFYNKTNILFIFWLISYSNRGNKHIRIDCIFIELSIYFISFNKFIVKFKISKSAVILGVLSIAILRLSIFVSVSSFARARMSTFRI